MPIISVIIPIYNAETTIEETVYSVLQQTHSDIEIIIVNDGSVDNSLARLEKFDDTRIRIISILNSGVSAARNVGMSYAKGDYYSFLDSDDLWAPDKLEAQLNALLDAPHADVAYSWTKTFNTDGEYPQKKLYYSGNIYDELILENFIGSGSNILVRKQAALEVGGFNADIINAEDWDFYLRLAWHSLFVVVPQYHIFYRSSNTSHSSNMSIFIRDHLRVTKQSWHLSSLPYNKILSYSYLTITSMHLYKNQSLTSLPKAFAFLLRSIYYYPSITLEDERILYCFQRILVCFIKACIPSTLLSWTGKRCFQIIRRPLHHAN